MFKKGDKVRCKMPTSKTEFAGVVTQTFSKGRNGVSPRCCVLVKKIINPGQNTFIRTGKNLWVDNQWIKRLK